MTNKVNEIIQYAADILGKENLSIQTNINQDIYDVTINYCTDKNNIDSEFKITLSEHIFYFCHRYTFDNKIMSIIDMPRINGQDGSLPYYTVFFKDYAELCSAVVRFCEALKEYEKRYETR